jgi:tripartite-type tricarboxylate transporter receptor subunit TctC
MEPAALLAKWLTKTVPYDVTSDFTPVALVATQALALFAHPSLPANDLNQLIAYARGNPGKLSIGTAGVGSPHHLAAAWLNTAAGIDITHVPYRGAAPALNDLLAGQIPLIWALPPPVMPFVEQGKVKALAVSTQKRFQNLPDVPTVAESGLQGFDINFFYGVAGPAKMLADAADQIAKAVGIIVARPDFRARMSTLGTSIDFRAGDAFRALIDQENSKYGVIIRDAGIKPD